MVTDAAQTDYPVSAPHGPAAEQQATSSTGQGKGPTQGELIAKALDSLELSGLRPILSGLREAITWSLVDQANHAASDAERHQLTADLFALNRWGERFESELLNRLSALKSGELPKAGHCRSVTGQSEELSLLDNGALERALEEKKLSAHLADRFHSQLLAIEELCQADPGKASRVSVQDLPISPSRITEAFGQLAEAMDLGPASLRIAFDTARVVFDRELGGVYHNVLAAAGVEGAAGKHRRPGFGQRQLTNASRNARTICREGAAGKNAPTVAHSDAASARSQQTHEGQASLAALWPQLGSVADLSPPEIIEALDRAARGRGSLAGLDRHDRQRAGLAVQLWELVRDDASRSSVGDSWQKRLQLPLLAAASADPEFFVRPDHPVRVLLDRLDEIGGILQVEKDAGLTRSVQDSVDHLLSRIDTSGVLDGGLLSRLAAAIEELAESQSKKFQRNVERVVKTCAGRDRLRHCRNRVQAELDRRYAGKQLPPAFGELLSAGWQTLLEISLLRSGEDGSDYGRHWETLDALIQRLGGEPHVVSLRPLSADTLLDRLTEGLEFAAVDPQRRAALMQRIGRLLAQASTEPPSLVTYRRPADGRRLQLPPEGVVAGEWDSALKRASGLKVGDIVLLADAPDGCRRLKTVWVGEDGWLYTFVDERGFKAADLTPGQLATKLVAGQVTLEPAEQRPLSERAIDRMLDDFRQQVDQQAESDPLTGLHNPSRFQAHLAHTLTDVGNGIPHCLLWIDVDQFTVLRNTFGLQAADQLRAAIARQLKQRFAGKGILAFLGGDQFAATLKRCGKEHAVHLAEELREGISKLSFTWEETGVSTSVSVAVIDLTEIHASCADVLQAADATLFAAKREGGNRCLVYNGDDGVINRRKSSMEWVRRVDQALERGHLDLRCQRIAPVDPSSGLKPHYELLLGVRDENEQALDIGRFIAAAESYNRMGTVDRWVARAAFQWAAEHPTELERLGGLAINLSGQSMNDEGIVDFLRQLFSETGVSPERISFEATETAAITHLGRGSHIIRAIKAMGSSFALDDFGSGFSSYSYLKQLPVDWLKIDGAFVRGIHRDPNDYGVVKSIHDLGHFMGKRTIAEYVEDDLILEKLREIGVDYAQGFKIERPIRLADLK